MAMVHRIIVVPRAFSDLDSVLGYIAKRSPQNTATTIDGLWRATQSLELLPHRYKVHEHRKDPSKAVRSMPVGLFTCTTEWMINSTLCVFFTFGMDVGGNHDIFDDFTRRSEGSKRPQDRLRGAREGEFP